MLYVVTVEDAKGGIFYNARTSTMNGDPKEANTNAVANDSAALKRFWDVSEERTGVEYL